MKLQVRSGWAERLSEKVSAQSRRLVDSHVHLAVTGLSGSGKTAFITSLVYLLLNAKQGAKLPFLSVLQENRLLGVITAQQKDLSVTSFQYEKGIQALSHNPPSWPESTETISQLRLKFRFKRSPGLAKLFGTHGTLTLDITDYPGEWLMDLPMLNQSYQQWCEDFWQRQEASPRAELLQPFLNEIAQLTEQVTIDEKHLANTSHVYTEFLYQLKQAGFGFIQPGRFIMPGELKGAPVLTFYPAKQDWFTQPKYQALLETLAARFENYKKKVVTPFYTEHFRHFDRQIVLLDVLGALNNGKAHFDELESSLTHVMKSFRYGKRSKLANLFSPKIDKLVVAATKADHASLDQQNNMYQLLSSLLSNVKQRVQYHGVDIAHFVLSAIRASESGMVEHEGKKVHVVKGSDVSGETVVMFPGEVPSVMPDTTIWDTHEFSFPEFAPTHSIATHGIQHIRMDQVIEYLLGDKLR